MSETNTNTNTIIVLCNNRALKEIKPLLEHLRFCGDIKHSAKFMLDEKMYYFDAESGSQLDDIIINGKSLRTERLESEIQSLEESRQNDDYD